MNEQKPCEPEYYELLEKLQALDFAAVELNLYLDTHPDDLHALQQYNVLVQERTQVANIFKEKYGPLMHFGHDYSRYPWEWSKVPWPWQV